MRINLAIVGAILLLAGCALPQRRVELLELSGGGEVLSYPADLRGAYIIGGRTCAEPMPDVALLSTEKLTGTIKLLSETGQSLEGSAAADLAAKVAELSGRTAVVLLARDLLYRACEASLNNPGMDQAAYVALFDRVADLVERLGRADEDRAAANLAREAAALQRSRDLIGAKP